MKSKKKKFKRKNTAKKSLKFKKKNNSKKKGAGRGEEEQLKVENKRYKQFLEDLGYGVPIEISIITEQGESKHLIGEKENVYKALVRVDSNISSYDINNMCPAGSNIEFGDTPITKDDTIEDLGIEDGGRINVNIIRCDMKVVGQNPAMQMVYLQCPHCKKNKIG